LHLAVPAYLLWLAVALVPALTAPRLDYDRLAGTLGRASLQFLIVYTVGLIALTLATRAVEPALRAARERRAARDPRAPVLQSKMRVASALRVAASLGDNPALRSAIERLEAAPWWHDDPRFQALSTDFARAADAFAASSAGSPAAEQAELGELAARTLNRLAAAAEQLGNEAGQPDKGSSGFFCCCSNVIGTVRPSVLAVLRLMTSSTLVDCWIGRSAGFAPLRMRAA